jgi:hypothetical protein
MDIARVIRTWLAPLCVALGCLHPAADAATTPPTFSRTDYPLLGNAVIAVDLNGDARLDLAGAGAAVRVQLANGDGTFAPAVAYTVGPPAQDLVAGDFNGDGRMDVIATLNDPARSLVLLAGNGDGTLRAPVYFPNTSGFDSPTLVAADLDNDGRLDVAFGHQIACFTAPCTVARTITVMLGNGDGSFQPAREIDIGTETAKLAVGDFNRDGIKDLVAASSRSRVVILLGAGGGNFQPPTTLTLIPDNNLGMDATDVDVADFNRDGFEDLVVAVALNGSRTAILTGNGDGSFRMPPLLITEPDLLVPQYQAVADFNGDTFLDLALALANGSNGLIEILNGNGDGSFQPPRRYFAPPDRSSVGTVSILAATLNSDGRPDLVLGVGGASISMAVLLNTTGAAPPPVPAAPSLVSPASGATVAQPVTLDWSNVANAASYEVQVDDSSSFTTPLRASATVTVSQATFSSLPATRLWWRVRARNSAGVAGPFSTARSFTPTTTTAAAALSALTLNPSTVVGGNAVQGTATLTAAAPAGGAQVTLTTSNPGAAMVPPSVTIAAGATSAAFQVTTNAVSASTPVTLTGAYASAMRSATLTVNPAAAPPGPAVTLSVSASGRSGERVTSSPAGISVAVGSTGSASFPSGTVITLSVSNGRDAVWSGACSSGGNKTRNCTFTIRDTAAVAANVQ